MHVAVRKVLPFVHEKRSNYNLHDLDRNRGLDSDSFAVEVSCSNNTCQNRICSPRIEKTSV